MPRLGILVVLLCLLLPGVAQAASGSLNVHVVGGGGTDAKVTGTRINCGTDCTDTVTWNAQTQLPPRNVLTATVPPGFKVTWSGDCNVVAGAPTRCDASYGDLEFSDGSNVTATFERVPSPPVLTLQAPLGNQRFAGDADIVVQALATDNEFVKQVTFRLGTKTVTLDGPDFGTDRYRTIFKAADLAHGPHTITVEAMDAASETTSGTVPIVVDKADPEVAITGGIAAGAWHSTGPAHITFATNEDATKVECSLKPSTVAATWGPCSEPGRYEATPANDGLWVFHVRATDAVGNDAVVSRMIKVDTIKPDIGLEGGPASTVVQLGTPTPIRAHVTDANFFVLQCRADEAAWQDCPNQGWQAEPNAAEGVRTWEFRATDEAGNVTEVAKSWRIDGTGPAITLAEGPAEGATVAPGVHGYRVTADDAVTGVPGVLCAWDDEALVPCPFPDATSRGLAPGVHRLRVRAVDGVGNASTVTRTFTVKAPATGGDGAKQQDGGSGGDQQQQPPSGGGTTPAPPPAPPSTGGGRPRADRTAPALTVTAPKKARSSVLRKGLALTVGCSEACTGTVALAGPKGLKASAKVTRAGRVTLRLKAAALKKALRGKRRVTLTVTVSVTDAAGNAASRKVTLTATP